MYSLPLHSNSTIFPFDTFWFITRVDVVNQRLNSVKFRFHRSHKFPVSRTSPEKLCDFIGYNFKSSTTQVGLNTNRQKVLHTSFASMSANPNSYYPTVQIHSNSPYIHQLIPRKRFKTSLSSLTRISHIH